MCLRGQGVKVNYSKAFSFYSKSAAQGDPNACYALGVIYVTGRGAKKSEKEALCWTEKAVDQDHAIAKLMLKN